MDRRACSGVLLTFLFYLGLSADLPIGVGTSLKDDLSRYRLSPSDTLPLVDLLENPDKSQDPQETDLNSSRLRATLGPHYNAEYMSVGQPLQSLTNPNGTVVYRFQRGRPAGPRPTFLANFGRLRLEGGSRRTRKLKIKLRPRKKVVKFLWSYTYCPVKYAWRNLGIRFWPRWIREGLCYRGRSCSIPPGMTCKPDKSTNLTLLRWHCRLRDPAKDCQWIMIQYAIITACACRC